MEDLLSLKSFEAFQDLKARSFVIKVCQGLELNVIAVTHGKVTFLKDPHIEPESGNGLSMMVSGILITKINDFLRIKDTINSQIARGMSGDKIAYLFLRQYGVSEEKFFNSVGSKGK